MKHIAIAAFAVFAGLASTLSVRADTYWLVIGSYRQGPGGKPAVSGITSPSLFFILGSIPL